ncbi:CoA-disulfide reductase [Alkalibacter saccharofermentans]|uniref:CoA-disulfide reductase n=1 Tax=Alkalibacter saccharofermentans DSM 14828 TaxID=1120975 RepID=A0A1M4TJM0_9FIRM|nr:CoA-disulfide reductase [Alkalibacter saccharofermentans]SHE44671.1 CoA-disulfide reductase [Alkalibacter saccharofermentans DSM 14828]
MSNKVLIIGGVAGGASAAARLRRVDEDAEIIMFERGEYISFANCGLPYYIGNVIDDRSKLLLQTPEAFNARFNVDVRVQNEVTAINVTDKTVTVKNHVKGETYEESYDKLVISTGSSPLRPPIPGIDAKNIFTIWNIPDTDGIKNYIESHQVKKAAVIGGGFIGVEMAENLHELGIEVSIIEMANQVMAPVDFDMAQYLHKHIESKDVDLVLEDGVKEFISDGKKTTVVTNTGKHIEADLIILSIGVRPNSQLAKDAGLKLNDRGGIVVDDSLLTSDPHIYAVGDVIEVEDYINKVPTMVPLAGPANKQGRMVANNIVGAKEKYNGTQGTSVAKVFDLTVANTGANEKTLNRLGKVYGKDYLTIQIHPNNHAGYYPGPQQMHFKLIFEIPSGKVLGAQIVGGEGSDKRVDVVAASIRFGATVYDLKELELAYAPPFSSGKDPVNMAGFTACNILDGDQEIIRSEDLDSLDPEKNLILDVRTSVEKTLGYIPGSINIPIDELRDRISELDKNKTIIVSCAVGVRAWIAVRILTQKGFKAKNLTGGFTAYSALYYNDPEKIAYSDESMDVEDEDPLSGNHPRQKVTLDCTGLQCPGPIMQVYNTMKHISEGDTVEITATDMGFAADIGSWCQRTNNTLLKEEFDGKVTKVCIMKGTHTEDVGSANEFCTQGSSSFNKEHNDKTMIVFSGDLDKALASFIIANGAAAMGRKVTMFFTFWGLNILRKEDSPRVEKSIIEKMFGWMMPKGSKKLTLSKMNMGGMGTKMMRMVMKDKNVSSLEELIGHAMANGVEMVACTMSMDVMGIKEEELIDGVKLAGVANMLAAAEESDTNLFI